ncbi:MAG: nucleotidyl transferase AbiEii/AbiGii toxin family protein [Polyangiaceae bacterium]|nr:nucleotidyl transferase AbiEii/AbiGii toxin family protein [Polyangiaceae bacterium]
MKRPPTNIAASVRDRLLKLAKANGEDFTYVLTRYALERLLVRLAASKHKNTFVLKGAMLFRVWSPNLHRPTKDLDLLGTGAPEPDRLARLFAEIAVVAVEDDGITFDPKSAKAARIKEDAEYEGVRVNLTAHVGSARLELQIDIGFGDAVTPGTNEVDFPTLLPMSAPRLHAYPRETVVAEKLQAMVHLGIANSRMKDFFDVWFLAINFEFAGPVLARAIQATFERRKTDLPKMAPLALTKGFSEDDAKMKQWKAFLSKTTLLPPRTALDEVVTLIAPFVLPPLDAARDGHAFEVTWKPKGPWE